MDKKIRLFDYKNTPKEIIIKDFEKVKFFVFEIKSGDGVLTAIYGKRHVEQFDSCDTPRIMGFDDGTWVIEPEDIDVLNRMKDHYDTDELDEVG